MENGSYKTTADLLGIRDFDNNKKRQGITIPSGSTVTVVGGPTNGGELVEVDWNGQLTLMFTDDLAKHHRAVGDLGA